MRTLLYWLGSIALAATMASGVQAAPYSSMVVFGDSLSDSGNNAKLAADAGATAIGNNQVITGNTYIPGLPYSSGVYSNGPVWASQFAAAAGITLKASELGGTNYAYGGARVGVDKEIQGITIPGLTSQFNSYLGSLSGPIDANTLFVLAGGGNTARDIATAAAGGASTSETIGSYALGMASMVGQLQALGAQHIVVWNVPNIGDTPAAITSGVSGGASFLAGMMNNALSTALSSLDGVKIFDIYGLTERAAAAMNDDGDLIFPNATAACGIPAGSCNGALFWDGIHPTTAAHAMIANEMLDLTAAVPEPAEYAMFFAGLLVVGVVVRRQRRS